MKLLVNSLVVCLGLAVTLPSQASWLQSPELLLGKQYTLLPESLCTGYSEQILGKVNSKEYGGLICEQERASYILLQQLSGYTSTGKAIWQVITVKEVLRSAAEELVVSAGCLGGEGNTNAIFALVKDADVQPYKVVQAWEADLATEQLKEINPQQVACYDPWLGSAAADGISCR